MNLWLFKVEKTCYFSDCLLFKRQCIYSTEKGYKVLNKLCKRGNICQCNGYERGNFFKKKKRGKGLDLGVKPPRINIC